MNGPANMSITPKIAFISTILHIDVSTTDLPRYEFVETVPSPINTMFYSPVK